MTEQRRQIESQIVLNALSEEIGAKSVQIAMSRAQIAGLQQELEAALLQIRQLEAAASSHAAELAKAAER